MARRAAVFVAIALALLVVGYWSGLVNYCTIRGGSRHQIVNNKTLCVTADGWVIYDPTKE